MFRRRHPGFFVAAAIGILLASISACRPLEGGPPEIAEVEGHLDLVVAYVPEGCDPGGLDGDGRGRVVGAAFDCPGGTTLRVERFDWEFNDDELPGSPSATRSGRVEWRDGTTGDVIRVVSDDWGVDVLMRVAESIELRS